jgi:hypothetical protein
VTQEEFLREVWQQIINPSIRELWIDNVIAAAKKNPDAPFADLGPALERMLEKGVSRRDLSLVMRFASYEAAFGLMYMLDDPGVDDMTGLHESLLTSDPSGKDGRPGSAP